MFSLSVASRARFSTAVQRSVQFESRNARSDSPKGMREQRGENCEPRTRRVHMHERMLHMRFNMPTHTLLEYATSLFTFFSLSISLSPSLFRYSIPSCTRLEIRAILLDDAYGKVYAFSCLGRSLRCTNASLGQGYARETCGLFSFRTPLILPRSDLVADASIYSWGTPNAARNLNFMNPDEFFGFWGAIRKGLWEFFALRTISNAHRSNPHGENEGRIFSNN